MPRTGRRATGWCPSGPPRFGPSRYGYDSASSCPGAASARRHPGRGRDRPRSRARRPARRARRPAAPGWWRAVRRGWDRGRSAAEARSSPTGASPPRSGWAPSGSPPPDPRSPPRQSPGPPAGAGLPTTPDPRPPPGRSRPRRQRRRALPSTACGGGARRRPRRGRPGPGVAARVRRLPGAAGATARSSRLLSGDAIPGEGYAEPPQRVMGLALDGADAHAEDLRGLRLAEIVEEPEHQDGPLLRGQARQRALHLGPADRGLGQVSAGPGWALRQLRGEAFAVVLAPA